LVFFKQPQITLDRYQVRVNVAGRGFGCFFGEIVTHFSTPKFQTITKSRHWNQADRGTSELENLPTKASGFSR
jgi:hypothetical protein